MLCLLRAFQIILSVCDFSLHMICQKAKKSLGTFLTFFTVLKSWSAMFFFTKDAGLPVYPIAFQKDWFTLRVISRFLIFRDAEFKTSNFLTEINFGSDMICTEVKKLFL